MAQSNFFQPGFDEQTENQNIERNRKYAELMRQQSEQSPQGSMVSGRYVAPSFTQGLAQMLKAYQGGQGMREADARQKALAEAVRGRQTEEIGQFTKLLNGAPAQATGQTYQTGANEMGDEAATVPQYSAAQKPDINAAYQYAAGAKTPGLQQAGLTGAMQMAQERAKQEQARAEQQRVLGLIQSAGSPQAAIAAGAPPDMVKQFYESKDYGRNKVTFKDTGGQFVPLTEYGDVPEGVAPLDKTGNPFSDVVVRDPKTGAIVPNAPLVAVKGQIAEKGAARTSLNVNMPDKKFYEGLGTAVSGQVEKGFEQAQAAVQTLNNANQIANSLDKAITGPMANQRLSLAQLGQALGVSGKDNEEVLTNTRNVIQGLARQELAAAGQMKGQGQITESERAILKKAESGEISQLTKPELQTLVGAFRKTARARIQSHQKNLERLGNDDQASTIRQYLQIEVPEDSPISSAAPTAPKGAAPRAPVFDAADAIVNGGRQ